MPTGLYAHRAVLWGGGNRDGARVHACIVSEHVCAISDQAMGVWPLCRVCATAHRPDSDICLPSDMWVYESSLCVLCMAYVL